MKTFIDLCFEFCCLLLYSVASLFRTDYRTANVVLFNIVGTVLTILGLINIISRLFSVPKGFNKTISVLMVVIVAGIVVLFLVALCRMLFSPEKIRKDLVPEGHYDENDPVDRSFMGTVDILMWIARIMHSDYNRVNIVVYIILMPLTILAGILVAWI